MRNFPVKGFPVRGFPVSGFAVTSSVDGLTGFYREVTVQASLVDGTHTDFPTLIYFNDPSLATVANGGKVQNADGHDIRFYLNRFLNGIKVWDLAHYNPVTGEGYAWVLLNINDSTDVTCVLTYGDPSISTYQGNRTTVWAAYSGVWHLNEASGDALDSSSNANTLTDNNTVTSGTGKTDAVARDFERSNTEYFNRGDNAALSTGDINFEIGMWVRFESIPAADSVSMLLGKRLASTNNLEYYLRYANGFGINAFNFEISSNGQIGGLKSASATTFGAASINTWYYVKGGHDATNNLVWCSVNGVANTAAHATGVFNGASDFRIGTSDGAGSFADEALDGLGNHGFLLKAARNVNRDTTEYANQNNPAAFAVVGSELPL